MKKSLFTAVAFCLGQLILNAQPGSGMTQTGLFGARYSKLNRPAGFFGTFNSERALGVYTISTPPMALLEINTNPSHFNVPFLVTASAGEVFRTDSPVDGFWRLYRSGSQIGSVSSFVNDFRFDATAGNMIFQQGGTEKMRVHAANGFVGVNMNVPLFTLDVFKDVDIVYNSNYNEGYRINGNLVVYLPGDASSLHNTFIGRAGNSSLVPGNNNTLTGFESGLNTTGTSHKNSFYGAYSGYNDTGDGGAFIGFEAGYNNTFGDGNTFVGIRSGYGTTIGSTNVCIGSNAGVGNVSGNGNIAIGTLSNFSVGTLNNAIAIGRQAIVNDNNKMILGNNSVNVGIGLSNDNILFGPQNKLEINADPTLMTYTGAGSGLRFRQLTTSNTPVTNPGLGLLAVDNNGDVIYVASPTNGCCLGNPCGNFPNPLLSSWEIPLDDNNYVFSGQGTFNNNVGIGTSCTPSAKLEVLQTQGPGLNNAVQITTNYNVGANLNRGILLAAEDGVRNLGITMSVNGSTSTANTLANASAGMILNMTANMNRVYGIYENLRIFNDGWGHRILMDGSASPVNVTGVEVDAFTTASGSNTCTGGHFSANGADFNYGIYATINPIGTGANPSAFSSPSGPNYAGYFDGDVVITGDLGVLSDKRLKKEIKPIENALDIINKLNPVTYHFDQEKHPSISLSGKKQYGFIAQELETVLPELTMQIVHPAINDTLGNLIREKEEYMGVNYNGLIAILTDALKEQQQQINELKALVEMKTTSRVIDANNQSIELADIQSIILDQNVPNPFAEQTTINYVLTPDVLKAQLLFYNSEGKLINSMDINPVVGKGSVSVFANDLTNGIYTYTLVADGKIIDTKKMMKSK
ncbi:MAG: tail fiber domain-containing protein [Fluviicola sp.]|nr:tail fiber domain-containing protein [Fluviicola sp.]